MSGYLHGVTDLSSDSYLLGHSEDELQRLEQQADIFATGTREILRRAGLMTGMRVLDVGCGVGDVTLAAARLVGPEGRVLGVDTSQEAVTTANRRIASSGVPWATCSESNVFEARNDIFDAIVGRFILMHLPAPAQLLSHLQASLAPHGVMVFVEMDISSASITPPMPLFEQCVAAIAALYGKAGAEPNMGSRLFTTFRQAGLEPALSASCHVEGGPQAKVYDYLARSIRSLEPSMRAHGIALEGDVDTLADRLKHEAEKSDYSVAYPRLTGAWARVTARPPA